MRPHRTLADRLADARRRRFVGRRAEQELFSRALDGDSDFAVLWIVGPGGVGKTTLLARLADLAEARGLCALRVDARHLAGPPEDFVRALHRDPRDAPSERFALFVDTAEDLGALEAWLRDHFLPALPERCVVTIAGREPPSRAWRRDPAWSELLRVVALRNLSPDEAREYLAARALDPAQIDALARSTFGHPLALSLLADLASRGACGPRLRADAPDVLADLLERFRVDAPSELHRDALAIAAHARITDVDLLRRAVDAAQAEALYDWLASLSISVVGADGLYLHDLAAQVLDADLRRRAPTTYLAMHRRARAPCVEALQQRTGAAQARAASDLSWMHRFSPIMGRVIDWSAARALSADALRPEDHGDIVRATRRLEGDEAAAAIARWIERQPEAFTVVRDPSMGPRGFIATLRLRAGDAEAWRDEPRVVAALDHAARNAPLRPDELLCVETWLDYQTHLDPGALASQLSIKDIRTWLGGGGVAWSVLSLAGRWDVWEPMMDYLTHAPIGAVRLGASEHRLYAHDWRAMSPAAFLDLMAEREVLGTAEGDALPSPRRAVVLSREDFAQAVRDALRAATDPDALARNPLSRSRVVLDAPAAEAGSSPLRLALERAVETLTLSGRDERAHAAIKITYLDPARTQEEAAELLGLAFSTYRRHLSAGVERVTEWLWQRELHG